MRRSRVFSTSRVGLVMALMLAAASACSRRSVRETVAERWVDALNSHDPEQVIALLDADATFSDPTLPQPLRRVALHGWLQQLWGLWKDRVCTATTVVTIGNTAVIEWHVQQTHPSGKSIPLDGVTILDIHDGRIHAVREFYDTSPFLQLLGR